jgi:hypothetical protein
MRIWRFVIQDGALYFYGSAHTFTLLPPHYEKNERENL